MTAMEIRRKAFGGEENARAVQIGRSRVVEVAALAATLLTAVAYIEHSHRVLAYGHAWDGKSINIHPISINQWRQRDPEASDLHLLLRALLLLLPAHAWR